MLVMNLAMIEAKRGYAFEDDHLQEVVVDLHALGQFMQHGYSPDKPNYTSNLVISGKRESWGTNR